MCPQTIDICRGARRNGRVGLERSTAGELEVRALSVGSLEVVLQLPADVLVPTAVAGGGIIVIKLAKILDAIKRVAGFPAELRLQRAQQTTAQLIAEAELLEVTDRLAETRARHRQRQLQTGRPDFDRVVVTDGDEEVL